MGVSLDELQKVQTPEGRVLQLTAEQVKAARRIDVLAEALPVLIPKISFPKTMYWTGRAASVHPADPLDCGASGE